MFTHLHVHSNYSLLEALPSPKELVTAAHSFNFSSLALTDHHLLTGVVEFYLACKESNILPILGLAIDVNLFDTKSNHSTGTIIVLACSPTGWSNLCHLSSLIQCDERKGVGMDQLIEFSKDLICLSGGQTGPVDQLLLHDQPEMAASTMQSLHEIFRGSLFVEIQRPLSQKLFYEPILLNIANRFQLPLVATQSIRVIHPDNTSLLPTLNAIRLNQSIPLDKTSDERDVLFLPEKVMIDRFQDLPEAIINTQRISLSCQFDFPIGTPQFPSVHLPSGITQIQHLRELAFQGAKDRYGAITPIIEARLNHELEVIAQRGFEPIFLIMQEIIEFTRQQGIPYSSRGSAASSLVAYTLGITTPDPIALDLYFERFLNPARSSPPDIDTDICSNRRDEVIQHVFKKYGADHVAMVATINRFRLRSAVGDVAKAHGLPPTEVRRLTNQLPHSFYAAQLAHEDENFEERQFSDLKKQFRDSQTNLILDQSKRLIGLPRHLSVHPGGVVITPGPMMDSVPISKSGLKGVIITQFDLDALEHMGLIKIDLLGIRGLSVIGDLGATIQSWRKKEYSSPQDVIESIPLTDIETSSLISVGNTIGCFQIESPGMRATLKELQAKTIDDIIAALALYRPGPLKGGLRDQFVRRHNHTEPVEHIHPSLSKLLQDTYGVILYQEQVLRIAHQLGGLSLTEADILRRAMSHFDPGKQMQILRDKFIHGSILSSGMTEETALKIWDMMAAFAGYGFPKAHAASYAVIAWRSAWLKSHFPAEFMAAVLANWGGYYSQRVYLSEARRLGLCVRPPHINHSGNEFQVKYPNGEPVLYMGLNQIRDLTHHTIRAIQKYRPFHHLEEFLTHVDPRPKEVINLISCGALSGLGTIPELLIQLKMIPHARQQPSLFGWDQTVVDDWSLSQKVSSQEEILGIGVDANPLELYQSKIEKLQHVPISDLSNYLGKAVLIVGVRQTSRSHRTSSGNRMGFLTIEDFDSSVDVIIFPAVYSKTSKQVFSSSIPLIIEGKIEMQENNLDPVLIAEKIEILS